MKEQVVEGSYILMVVFGIFITGCATTHQFTTPTTISPSGTFAALLPYLSITDVWTEKEMDTQQLAEISHQVQIITQKILHQKLVTLIPMEKSNECVKDKDFRQTIERVIKNEVKVAPDIFICFESAGANFLLVVDIKAKIGGKGDLTRDFPPKILPLPNPYYHNKDPSLCVLSGIIIDLKKQQVIWKNEVSRRENITKETVLANLLEELFKFMKSGKEERKND